MQVAMADLKLDRLLVVVPGEGFYELGPKLRDGALNLCFHSSSCRPITTAWWG
jgi:hypothetical protein